MIAELEIDLGAIARNAARLAALVAPAKLAPVVKANAYGHGLLPVALALAPRAAMLCVFAACEALELRAAGIAHPVLVLGPVEHGELRALVREDVAIALWSEGAFPAELARLGAAHGRPVTVHAKIETGVARLGLAPERAPAALAAYRDEPRLALAGIYTHLAAAEELESEFTLEQLARFERVLARAAGGAHARP
ncbi:MAG: alanine racemase, partial [Vulcanimicrobiaceae bacterium]